MREMLRNPASEKKLSMLNRLPEFTSILRSYFIQEKKAAIVIEEAVAKLLESYHTSISQSKEYPKPLTWTINKYFKN